MPIFGRVSKRKILVKCGGFSSQLERVLGEKVDGHPLWSSRFDLSNPEAVVQTHLDYLNSGAQIILTNTYQASVEGYMKHLNLSKLESIETIRKSVRLAKEAKKKFKCGKPEETDIYERKLPLILASIGPYGAHLHDGSEYKGSYGEHISKEDIQEWHRDRITACIAEGVDGLAFETIPCQMEAEAVVRMVLKELPGLKFWVSFQCKDETSLAHGENFSEALLSVWNIIKDRNAVNDLYGIGVNCVNPKFVTPLFKSVKNATEDEIPFVVYSNRGEIFDGEKWTGQDDCIPLDCYVKEWLELGAKIIGGCCRVYPADIKAIRARIEELLPDEIEKCEAEIDDMLEKYCKLKEELDELKKECKKDEPVANIEKNNEKQIVETTEKDVKTDIEVPKKDDKTDIEVPKEDVKTDIEVPKKDVKTDKEVLKKNESNDKLKDKAGLKHSKANAVQNKPSFKNLVNVKESVFKAKPAIKQSQKDLLKAKAILKNSQKDGQLKSKTPLKDSSKISGKQSRTETNKDIIRYNEMRKDEALKAESPKNEASKDESIGNEIDDQKQSDTAVEETDDHKQNDAAVEETDDQKQSNPAETDNDETTAKCTAIIEKIKNIGDLKHDSSTDIKPVIEKIKETGELNEISVVKELGKDAPLEDPILTIQ